MRKVACAVLAVLVIGAPVLDAAAAVTRPDPAHPYAGFRLFARSVGALSVNQVYCGLVANGVTCVDTTGSATVGGGYWPKGTADQYVFAAGFQVAGIVGGIRSENPWAGDTTGDLFINFRGGSNGEQVRPIYNSTDPGDVANWPAAAYVPDEPNEADNLFHPALRGRLRCLGGRRLVAYLGREPVAQSESTPSARPAPGATRHGLEHPERQPGHHLLHLHPLQHHLHPRGGLRRRAPRHARDSAGQGSGIPGEEQCGVRHHAAPDRLSDHQHARGVRSGHGCRSVR